MRVVTLLAVNCCLIFLTACSEHPLIPERKIVYEVADYDFIQRQFFLLENPGSDFSNPSFALTRPVIGGPEIDSLELFVSLKQNEWGLTGKPEFIVKAFIDPENDGITGTESSWTGRFIQMVQDKDFGLIQDNTGGEIRYIGIRLYEKLDEPRALAVRYKAYDESSGSTFLVGDYNRYPVGDPEGDTLVAELICPPVEDFGPTVEISPYPSTWKMMMRNIYSIGIIPAGMEDVKIRIEDLSSRADSDRHPESGLTYIRLFGLDRFKEDGGKGKDGRVDDIPEVWNHVYGYLIFPWSEGFNPPYETMLDLGYIDTNDPSEAQFEYNTLVRDSIIYNSILTSQVKSNAHNYNIVIEIDPP